jgi:predicted nucleotidyltransferase
MRDMIEALQDQGVAFLVVGAFALAAHGAPRATGDIDLWVQPQPDNARRVMGALASFGAPLDAHGVSACDFTRPGLVYQLGLPPNRIDLLTAIDGVRFEDAWPRRATVPMFGRQVAVLGREDLIANKRAAARPQDLLDVALLERQAPTRG